MKIVGKPLSGLDMHKYGLPYDGITGMFRESSGPDSIDLMLAAVESYYPEIHPLSVMRNGVAHNCFKEDASFYLLFTGNCDPDLEFSVESSLDDLSEEELNPTEFVDLSADDLVMTLEEINAINWGMQKTFGIQFKK